MFETTPIKALVADKEMMIYEHDGFWQPMDSGREYRALNEMYNRSNAPWVIWE